MKSQLAHTFYTKPCVWGRLAARLSGVPVVVGTLPGLRTLYADDSLISRLIRMVYQKLQQIACHYSNLTIFQNQNDARQFISAGVVAPEKATVVPGSSVSTQVFNPTNVPDVKRNELRVELGLEPGTTVITLVSRIIRSKGVLEFAAGAQEV